MRGDPDLAVIPAPEHPLVAGFAQEQADVFSRQGKEAIRAKNLKFNHMAGLDTESFFRQQGNGRMEQISA